MRFESLSSPQFAREHLFGHLYEVAGDFERLYQL